MVLSKKIENVIDKEYQLIINDIPLADYLYDLRSIGLISDDEVIKLRDDCKNNKERVFEFLKILKSRSDENFFQFCCILKESQVRHIQDIGKALEIEANIPNKHTQIQATASQIQPRKKNPLLHPFRAIKSTLFSKKASISTSSPTKKTFPLASSSQSVSEYSSSENSPSKNPSSENFPLVNPPLENLLLETSSSEIPVLEFSTSDLSLAKSSSSQISILDFDVPENLLRNLPPTPSNHYVMRKDAVNTICDQLKIINDLSGHLLIHGMAGSGKTVTVCQSVRQAAKRGYFKSNGCYWMKIGNISNGQLSNQLKILGISLGIEWKEHIQSIGEISAALSYYLQVNSRISDTLFIFDDIWIKDHYNYLSFAKKSIATSRFLYYENELTHYCIRLPEQLAFDEAIELLSLHRHDRDTQVLRDNPIIKNVIDSCAGLPLAINLIGGLHLDTNEDWNKAKAIISNKSKKVRLANYNFNLHGTLQLSVESIEENDRRLFESLVVFKRVNIPIESIASLWNCDEQDTDDLLVEMNNKSLLRYVRGNKCYCVIHDLMVDYLQQKIYSQSSNQDSLKILNEKLLDSYLNRCHGRWNVFPDDGYFYQNLIYHALIAESDENLTNIMADFNWMTCKIRSDKIIYNLIRDITDYVNYLQERKQNWENYNELLGLLKQQQVWFGANSVIQIILWVDMTSSWMKERALQLAVENTQDSKHNLSYWTIAECSTSIINPYTYDECREFGRCKMDFNLSISNPAFGQCRIIGTENCWKKNCQIVIKDYETLDLVLRISPPEISIESIEIAADGCTVAFKDVMETWIIYNIDKNERMNFVENDEQEDADDRFYSLQFYTMKCENSLIMTLNQNRLGLRIWKIENDQILPTIKQISSKYQIESCRWIMAPNRKQILLWYRKFDYNGDPKHRPKDRQNWINESQIELWDLETWSIQRSLKMPAFVFRNAGGYIATNDFEHGLSLYCINYINRNTEFIISAYGRFGLDDGTMGLIKLEDDINASQNLIEFSNRFQIILHENQYIKNISVSDDHQFIAIDFSREDVGVLVLRIIEDQVRYYAKVKPSVISKSIFIPGKNRLLVHDYWDKHCLYEYNLQGHNIHWQDIQDSNSNLKYIALKDGTKTTVKVLDVCMAYVNSIPVVAVLNLDINDSYQLEVYCHQVLSSTSIYHHRLKQQCHRCFLYNDLPSAIVVRIIDGESNIVITEVAMVAYFLDADHVEEPRELLNYSIPKECVGSYKITSRHRKTDNVLIFIIHSEICLEEYGMLIIIITINLKTGKKIIYEQDDMYRHISQIYADDCYLYTYQEKDTLDKENLCNVKCYKFGDGKQQTQLIKTYPYDVQNGSVFKISVDSNQLVYSPVITYSRKYKKKDLFIEIYGETKADAIVNHWYSSYIIFLLENGDHAAILNKHGEVIMKMYKNSKIKVDPEAIIFNNENLWSNKHFLAYYRSLSSLHFYDSKTLQLQMTLPFPHFEIMDMQWNCQKSSFIVSNRCDNYYCFIKRIE